MRGYTLTIRYVTSIGGAPINYSIKLVAKNMESAKTEAIEVTQKIFPSALALWAFAITATGPEVP